MKRLLSVLRRHWLPGSLLLLGVVAGGYLALRPAPPAATVWKLATVQRGTLESTISSTGTLAALETVEVGTQISGTIKELLVDYNSPVKKGQILARLDPALYQAAQREAEAGVAQARATLGEAEENFQRDQPLFAKGYLSAQEFAPTRTAVATARAGLASAEGALLRARTNLAYTVIRSPIDGKVIKRSVEAGQTVAASLNTPTLFIIARDLEQMQIEVNVDESDIGQIREGQAVRFTVQSWPEEKFTGSVTQIRLQPTTISNVVNYSVMVQAANPKGLLLPGMTATVDFIVSRVENALLVPNAALRFVPEGVTSARNSDGTGTLYTVGPSGSPQALAVSKGESDGLATVVSADGLREGEQVITGIDTVATASAKKTTLISFMRPPRPPRQGSAGAGGPP